MKQPLKHNPRILFISIFTALVVLGGAGFYYIKVVRPEQALPVSPAAQTKSGEDEIAALVSAIGKHIVLPTDEVPTVATVEDPGKLRGQPFFAQAKQGDKVLIYAKAKTAILYSPEKDRIVAVAPLSLGKEAGGATSSPR